MIKVERFKDLEKKEKNPASSTMIFKWNKRVVLFYPRPFS